MGVRYSLVDATFGIDGLEYYHEIVTGETPDAAFARLRELLHENPGSAIWLDVWGIHEPMLQTPYPHSIEPVRLPEALQKQFEAAWDKEKVKWPIPQFGAL